MQLGIHINHLVGGSLFSEENLSRLLLFFDSVHILVHRCIVGRGRCVESETSQGFSHRLKGRALS